jgi:hypothetical protein|nr:MAG TPA: hypothetical protein [Caudoviricetes sp.]
MACIGKIKSGLAMPCGAVVGARPVSAKLLNASDIASFTVGPAGDAKITLKTGALAYDITTINNSMSLTVGLKSQDIIPGAYDVSVTFKDFAMVNMAHSRATPLGVVNDLQCAELVLAVEFQNLQCNVYGLGAPLVCLETSYDSTGDGLTTFTYGVEDWQVGTTIHYLSRSDYALLSSSTPAPAPAPQPTIK